MSIPRSEGIPEEIRQMIADMREAREEARAYGTQIAAEREAMAKQAREAELERARAARSGELGPEWERVQRRIDSGATSFAAIMQGEDTSADAEAIRGFTADNLARTVIESQTTEQQEVVDARLELADSLRGLKSAIESLNETRPNGGHR